MPGPYYDAWGVLDALKDVGFFDVILPFLAVFVVFFAILEKTRILGTYEDNEPRTRLNALFSLIVAFLVLQQYNIVFKIVEFLPKIALLAIVLIMFLFLTGIFGGESQPWWEGGALIVAGIFVLVLTIWAFFSPEFTGDWQYFSFWWRDNLGFIVLLITLIIVLALFSSPKKDSGPKNLSELFFKKYK